MDEEKLCNPLVLKGTKHQPFSSHISHVVVSSSASVFARIPFRHTHVTPRVFDRFRWPFEVLEAGCKKIT